MAACWGNVLTASAGCSVERGGHSFDTGVQLVAEGGLLWKERRHAGTGGRMEQQHHRQRWRRRSRPAVAPHVRLLGVGLTLSALAGTACALLSRQPAPAPFPQHASRGRPCVRMTALQPERPHTQQVQQQVQQPSVGAWAQQPRPAEGDERTQCLPALQRYGRAAACPVNRLYWGGGHWGTGRLGF